MTYIHADADDHQLGVKADQRRVLGQPMLLYEPDLHGPQEVPVQTCIDDQDQYL